MGLAEVVTEKNLEDCYSVDMNDAVATSPTMWEVW